MVILDTNVVSALMHEPPDPAVVVWLDSQPRISVWTTSVTLMEIGYGIESLARGRRQSRLFRAFELLISEKMEHRIAAFDAAAANAAVLLIGERRRAGRVGEMRDTMIAGIVIASHAALATRNTHHFSDLAVPVVNPWNA